MQILLDIDGVMLPAKPWSAPQILEDGFSMFKSQSVSALNQILLESNSDILLTTSHKDRYSPNDWVKIFRFRGVNVNSISKLPPNDNHLNRREEIIKWFTSSEEVSDFVILDDDSSLNDLPIFLKDRLILTKPLIGLTSGHVEDSLRILNTPLEFAEDTGKLLL